MIEVTTFPYISSSQWTFPMANIKLRSYNQLDKKMCLKYNQHSDTAYLRKENSVHIWTVLECIEDSCPLVMAEQNQQPVINA